MFYRHLENKKGPDIKHSLGHVPLHREVNTNIQLDAGLSPDARVNKYCLFSEFGLKPRHILTELTQPEIGFASRDG